MVVTLAEINAVLDCAHLDPNEVPIIPPNQIGVNRRKPQMSATAPKFNPSGDPLIGEIKEASNALANVIEKLPSGRRRSTALTYLETASMWAVKAAVCEDR